MLVTSYLSEVQLETVDTSRSVIVVLPRRSESGRAGTIVTMMSADSVGTIHIASVTAIGRKCYWIVHLFTINYRHFAEFYSSASLEMEIYFLKNPRLSSGGEPCFASQDLWSMVVIYGLIDDHIISIILQRNMKVFIRML